MRSVKVKDLKRGMGIETILWEIKKVEKVTFDKEFESDATIHFQDGKRYYCLSYESVDIVN